MTKVCNVIVTNNLKPRAPFSLALGEHQKFAFFYVGLCNIMKEVNLVYVSVTLVTAATLPHALIPFGTDRFLGGLYM